MRFADTNILLYAISTDASELDKARVANAILDDRQLRLSTQVLQEFYVQATRASRHEPLSHEQAAGLVESFLRFEIEPTTPGLVVDALGTRSRFGISYWDAAIIEAARHAGCDVVLSEDLQDGQDFDGVLVQNPFSTP